MHTGRFYSCFDFTGPSLRPKLSNRCFGSYSDIQLVCIDIKIVLNYWEFLPFQPPHRSHFLSKSRLLRSSLRRVKFFVHSIPYWLVESHDSLGTCTFFALFRIVDPIETAIL
jgi:hypothetical protein